VADNRTEKPNPKRRKEARDKGQIARSTDLTSAAVLLGGILAVVVTAPAMLDHFSEIVRVGLSQSARPTWPGGPESATCSPGASGRCSRSWRRSPSPRPPRA